METTIKAHGGNRKSNLYGIAKEMEDEAERIGPSSHPGRRLINLAKQLRIIGKEWRARQDAIERAEKAIAMYVNHEKEEMLVYAEVLDCLRAVK